jgi:hypothetical protein
MAVALADYRSEVGQRVRGRGYACRDSGFVTGRSRWAGVGCIIGGEEICFFFVIMNTSKAFWVNYRRTIQVLDLSVM